MPLQKLQFRPGLNREGTTLSNEGGWFDGDKIRFRSGYPEKIGGWVKDSGTEYATSATGTFVSGGTTTALQPTTGSFWGICRSLFNWITLAGNNLVSLGTSLKYYIQDSVNGYFYDITPIRYNVTISSNAFTTVNASNVVTCNVPNHGAQAGDFVTISGVSGTLNNIPASALNLEFQITSIVDNNSFKITTGSTANASGSGGSSVVFNFQLTIGGSTYGTSAGWGAGGWGGTLGPSQATALNGTINSSATTVVVTSTSGFTSPSGSITIGSEIITYTGTTGTSFTGCTRGASGTLAVAHTSGDAVYQYTGATGWGASSTSGTVTTQLRLWSQSNFGQDLIFAPRSGSMYYWAVNTVNTIYDRGQVITPSGTVAIRGTNYTCDATTPTIVNKVLVSDASRYTIAFGCNDPTGVYADNNFDPMQVRWSNQEQFNIWQPLSTNTAGGYRLSTGSQIVTAIQTRQEILVLTDAAIYSMQFLGAPYVWGFQIMGDNISIMGPNAAITVNNVTYWMGADKFYMYSGRVETLPCALRQYIYDDINLAQNYQIFAGGNEGYNEIWWYYCSISGPDGTGTLANPNTIIDKYVIYNYLERTWYYGNLQRTAWIDSPLRNYPMATGYIGNLIYHEDGVDDNATGTPVAINSYVQSSDFDIGDGHNFGFVWRIIPDLTFDGSTVTAPSVNFTVLPRQNPGSGYGSSDNPYVTSANNYSLHTTYTVQKFTQQVYVRVRGRQMSFQISSNSLGVQWQLGSPRIDVRSDGRR
jgi:hypothetical protein